MAEELVEVPVTLGIGGPRIGVASVPGAYQPGTNLTATIRLDSATDEVRVDHLSMFVDSADIVVGDEQLVCPGTMEDATLCRCPRRHIMQEAPAESENADNPVSHPNHYTAYPGVEIIDLTKHLNFCRGNVVKYVSRAGQKAGVDELEDLKKARQYIDFEIQRVLEERHRGND